MQVVIDILENELIEKYPDVLGILLRDQTTQKNIFWATYNYEHLGVMKVTQDNNKEVWKYVPLQDFSENSKIDWTKSIVEIDQQLYAKYKLTKTEIEFIEKMIKPIV